MEQARAARRVWWERVQIMYREWWEEKETKEHHFTPFTTAFLTIYTKISPQNWSWAVLGTRQRQKWREGEKESQIWSEAVPPVNPVTNPVSVKKQKEKEMKQKNRQELEERVPEKNYSRLSCPLSPSLFPSALAFLPLLTDCIIIMPASSKFGQWRIMKN